MTTPGAPQLTEAEDRYLNDAEFHARVTQAVNTLRLTLHGRPVWGSLNSRERELVTLAASMGLLMAEFDLLPGGAVERPSSADSDSASPAPEPQR